MIIDIAIIALLPFLKISFPSLTGQLITISGPRLLLLLGFLVLFQLGNNWQIPLIIGMLAGTFFYIWGMVTEPASIQFTHLNLTSDAVSKSLKILHLSDLHIERISRRVPTLYASAKVFLLRN